MKLVILIGPSAVGKMTVGQQLSEITGINLLHNHQTIELVLETSGKYDFKLIDEIRKCIISYYSKENRDIIITLRHNFNSQASLSHLYEIVSIAFNANGLTRDDLDVYVVELYSDLETRLRRNKTENRLKNKKSKENIVQSELEMIEAEKIGKYSTTCIEELKRNIRLGTLISGSKHAHYMRIDNTNLDVYDTAILIKDNFKL